MSVAVLMATRRSSAVDHGPGRVEGATPKMPTLMILQGFSATLNSDTSGLLPKCASERE